jgi:hypothetical protein
MKLTWLLIVFGAAAVVGAIGWHLRTHTIAYRLTVEVSINGETFTGSGVVATDYAVNVNPLSGGQPFAFHDRGEPLTIDLGQYGPLFMTLRGRYDLLALAQSVYGNPKPDQDMGDFLRRLAQPKVPAEIPHDALPLLIRFSDVNQPATAECVDPDFMAESFPPGTEVSLAHATIAIVNEPVTTTGLSEKRLTWLSLPQPEQARLLTGPVWNALGGFGLKPCKLHPRDLELRK